MLLFQGLVPVSRHLLNSLARRSTLLSVRDFRNSLHIVSSAELFPFFRLLRADLISEVLIEMLMISSIPVGFKLEIFEFSCVDSSFHACFFPVLMVL